MKTLSDEYLSILCMEFSDVFASGLPVSEGFRLIAENEEGSGERRLFEELCSKTEIGTDIHTAMKEADVFPEHMLDVVELGMHTGNLAEAFASLSVYFERQRKISHAIKSMVVFPAILTAVMLAVIYVMITEVLPIFNDVLERLGLTMAPVAEFMLKTGAAMKDVSEIFAVLALLLIAFLIACNFTSLGQRMRELTAKLIQKTDAGAKMNSLTFIATMSMVVSAGMTPEEGLDMAVRFCRGKAVEAKIMECKVLMETENMFLAEAVSQTKLLKPIYCKMLTIASRTGNMDTAMAKIAHRCEDDVDESIYKVLGRIEPCVIAILCVVVGLLLLGVMTPLLGIMAAI